MKRIGILGFSLLVASLVALTTDSDARDPQRRRVVSQEIEINVLDDVVVRLKYPPPQFDEKGKPKKLTAEEKRALKGPDPKLPGYNADFTDIKQGQFIQVQLAKLKPTKAKSGTSESQEGEKRPKQEHTVVTQLVGQISRLEMPRAGGPVAAKIKGAKKKGESNEKSDSGRKLYIRVESIGVGNQRPQIGADGRPIIPNLGPDVFVSQILILEDPPKAPDPS